MSETQGPAASREELRLVDWIRLAVQYRWWLIGSGLAGLVLSGAYVVLVAETGPTEFARINATIRAPLNEHGAFGIKPEHLALQLSEMIREQKHESTDLSPADIMSASFLGESGSFRLTLSVPAGSQSAGMDWMRRVTELAKVRWDAVESAWNEPLRRRAASNREFAESLQRRLHELRDQAPDSARGVEGRLFALNADLLSYMLSEILMRADDAERALVRSSAGDIVLEQPFVVLEQAPGWMGTRRAIVIVIAGTVFGVALGLQFGLAREFWRKHRSRIVV